MNRKIKASSAYGQFKFSPRTKREPSPVGIVREASDAVNHPKHYVTNPSGVECIEVVEHMSFNIGNAVKYLWRCGLKDDVLIDLKKARWYVEREIARIEKEREG